MPRSSCNVWKHFLTLSKANGKKHVICCFCTTEYKHAMANKLKRHLSKCSKCPNEVKQLYKDENVQKIMKLPSEASSTPSSPAMALSTVTRATSTSDSHDSPNTTSTAQPVRHSDINSALVKAIRATGQPMSMLESEHWKRVFSLLNPSYTVPTKHTLSNTLQELEYERIKDEINVKFTNSLALGLIIDGRTNVIGRGVINTIVTTPEPIFYHAIYPKVNTDIGDFISGEIVKIINEIGPAKFVVLVTDNTANMKTAWRIVRSEFPHISCVGCLSDSLNLIYKDIFKSIELFKAILEQILQVIKYIKHTPEVSSQFEKYQVEKFGSSACNLKMFTNTRWSGASSTMNSYKQNREAMELLIMSNDVTVPQEIKKIILDTKVWIKLDEIINILDPLETDLRSSEKDNALLSDAPFIFKNIYQNISQKLEESVFIDGEAVNIVLACIVKREKMCVQPIHLAAHLLDPRYCDRNILNDEEISQASEFIRNYCIINGIDEVNTLSSMAEFYTRVNFFEASKAIWRPAKQLEPRLWWQTFASKQSIGVIAAKILSVPPSATVSERNFKLFSYKHTKIKNLADIRICKTEAETSQYGENDYSVVKLIDQSEHDGSCDNDTQSDIELSDDIDPLQAVDSLAYV